LTLTIVVYVADLAGARTAWAGIITPESGGSSNADSIEGLYRIVLIIAAVIFCAVAGALVYFLVKYRARRGHIASQVRGNTRLEIAWTGAAALILVVLAVLTFSRLHGVVTPAASADDAAGAVFATVDQPAAPGGHALHVKITGRQFVWRFEYPNGAYSYEELVVPIGTTVVADIYSADVNHSWWVPKLGGKFDAIPGYVNHTWFKITRAGVFVGQCAELCGQHHAQMIATVRAIPLTAWESWLGRQKQLIAQAKIDDRAAQAKLNARTGAARVENP
jgi:cytochrome c oxidase subunit II